MDAYFIELGLQEKEVQIYQLLIDLESATANEIAKKTKESRTNTYMLLEDLESIGLVQSDTSQPVKRFIAKDPRVIDELLAKKQATISQQRKALGATMKNLRSRYRLARNKPGVLSAEGLENFDTTLKAMERSTTPIWVIGSADAPQNKEAYEVLKKRIYQRKIKCSTTKILFHEDEHRDVIEQDFKNRGVEVRFIGDTPFNGEVAIYDETVVFTSYMPVLVTTAITDKSISETMRTVFRILWDQAKT